MSSFPTQILDAIDALLQVFEEVCEESSVPVVVARLRKSRKDEVDAEIWNGLLDILEKWDADTDMSVPFRIFASLNNRQRVPFLCTCIVLTDTLDDISQGDDDRIL